MMNVEPIFAPLVTKGRLALRDLVRMVRKCIIDTAAVDIEIFPKILFSYARALNVPTGVTYSEGRVPL